MAKKTSIEEVQQLIDLGKEKGYLTYDEVNDILPPDMVSSEQIDDVMSMFGEMDIEVVDSEQKVPMSKERSSGDSSGGMHICCRLTEHIDDEQVHLTAVAKGLQVVPLSRFYHSRPKRMGLVLGFTACKEEDLSWGVEKLMGIIADLAS